MPYYVRKDFDDAGTCDYTHNIVRCRRRGCERLAILRTAVACQLTRDRMQRKLRNGGKKKEKNYRKKKGRDHIRKCLCRNQSKQRGLLMKIIISPELSESSARQIVKFNRSELPKYN